jgi:tetratricopeptide (TPR) repeat protein
MKAYEADPDNLPAAVLNGIFISAARLYNSKEFTIEQVFETYNLVSEAIQRATDNIYIKEGEYATKLETGAQLDAKEAKDTAALKRELYRFDVVNGNVEKTLAPIATCEKLQLLYNQETFIENKSDADWLRRASKMLSKERRNEEGEMEDCTDLPIFFVIAEENYKLEPSPISARAVGKLAWSRKDYAKAVEYFKEAAESEVDPNKKADDYLKVAISHQKLGQLSSAKTNSLKAASLRKKWGDPYVLIATLYGASEGIWGSNVVEKKAVYWAAIDKLKYAKSIDSDVTNKSNRLIEAYEKQLPDKSVAFQLAKKDGDRICIGSWINECVIAKF